MVTQVLALVKARLGISTAVRDVYLTAIINGVIDELTKEKGIVLDDENAAHLMFCVDYSTWRYQSAQHHSPVASNNASAMPRHLQFRLHNLIISAGGNDV